MRSTTEKQWRDPKWWNENAGSASYYCPVNAQFYDAKLHPCCIPRPTQWKGPQDGLPPEGTNCRVVQTINNYMVCKDATITYQGASVGCYINNDNGMEYSVSHHDYSFLPVVSDYDKAITKIQVDSQGERGAPISTTQAINLHDAGYRKLMSRAEAKSVLVGLKGTICKDVPLMSEDNANTILDALGYKE